MDEHQRYFNFDYNYAQLIIKTISYNSLSRQNNLAAKLLQNIYQNNFASLVPKELRTVHHQVSSSLEASSSSLFYQTKEELSQSILNTDVKLKQLLQYKCIEIETALTVS